MSRLALFDLDRTLIDVNSGRLWVRHEWNAGNLGARDVTWAAWWLLRYSLGFADGMDEAYRQAVRTLEGTTEWPVRERTFRWFEDEVRHRLRPGAAKRLAEHRAAGHRLVVATTSSPYAAEAAAVAFGLEHFISTEFEVEDGVFTGRVAKPAWGDEKAARVEEWAALHGHDLDDAVFYTDSMTDVALLERVGEPVCVNPDRRLARHAAARGWPIVDWGTASVPAR